MPVILAIHKAEIRGITVGCQSWQIVCETLSQKSPSQKGLTEWLKVKALNSSPNTEKKKKEKITFGTKEKMVDEIETISYL
jgi:hypothetical protein